jgi:hypothetical protein
MSLRVLKGRGNLRERSSARDYRASLGVTRFLEDGNVIARSIATWQSREAWQSERDSDATLGVTRFLEDGNVIARSIATWQSREAWQSARDSDATLGVTFVLAPHFDIPVD